MKKYILIGFDLESTDKKVTEDEITEIGSNCRLCEVENKQVSLNEGFRQRVKCNKLISPEASAVTGIKNEDLKNEPPLLIALKRFTQYIDESCKPYPDLERILTAYNGTNFDIPLLVHELRRNDKDPIAYFREWKISYFVDPFVICKNVLDTTLLEQNDRQQPNYKLECIYRALFKKPLIDAHSALADTDAMLDLILQNSCISSVLESELLIGKESKYLTNFITLAQNVKKSKEQNNAKNKKRTHSEINFTGMRKLIAKYT